MNRTIVKQVESKNSSAHYKVGIMMLETVSINCNKFNDVIVQTVINVAENIPRAKRICIIANGAGGHTVAEISFFVCI